MPGRSPSENRIRPAARTGGARNHAGLSGGPRDEVGRGRGQPEGHSPRASAQTANPGAKLAAMTPVLLDTGPVVALLDAADGLHAFVRAAFAQLPAGRPLVTTAAVITEVMSRLQDCAGGPGRAIAFVEDARVRVEQNFHLPQLRAAAALMEKYSDVPMDFADATLVLLAAHYETGDIATLDPPGIRRIVVPVRSIFGWWSLACSGEYERAHQRAKLAGHLGSSHVGPTTSVSRVDGSVGLLGFFSPPPR